MNQHIERLTQLQEQATFDALELQIITSDGSRHHSVHFVNQPAQQPSIIQACIEQGFVRVNQYSTANPLRHLLELNPNHIVSVEIFKNHGTVFIASDGMAELVKRGYTNQKIILSQDEYADIKRYVKKNTLYENDDL